MQEVKTSQLFPLGKVRFCEGCPQGLPLSEIVTLDSVILSDIDATILYEKLHHKDTDLLSDGTNHYIMRENILVKINHPKIQEL